MAEDEDALRRGVEEDAVRIALDGDRLNRGQCFSVKHYHGVAAEEAVAGFGVGGDAVDALGVGDFAGGLEGVQL